MSLLLPSIVVGIIVGIIRGGSLSRLAEFPFRYGWLVIVALALEVLIFSSWFEQLGLPAYVLPALYILSLLMLLAVVVMNRARVGVLILGVGIFLNFLVIATNGGYMPASAEVMRQVGLEEREVAMRDKGYVTNNTLATPESKLAFLGDYLYIDLPLIRQQVFSPGDAFIAFGMFILVSQAMVWRRRPR